MDDLASHIAHRRAQLVDLKAMHADGHTGAAEAIERVTAALAQLGAGDDDQVDDVVAPVEPELEAPAAAVEPVAPEPAPAPVLRRKALRAGKPKRKR